MATAGATGGTVPPPLTPDTPANEPAFCAPCARVRPLMLNKGAKRVMREREEHKRDELWLGTGHLPDPEDDDRDIAIYLRLAEPQPVAAELLCAVMGRALGLPVPEPFLLEIPPGTLPRSARLDPARTHYCFASEDVGGLPFQQLLRSDSAFAEAMIRCWEHLVPLATFDEWIANTDRNFGNLIFVANALWLIDHADALGGSMSMFGLSELTDQSMTNIAAKVLADAFPPERHPDHLEAARDWLHRPAAGLSVAEALDCAGLHRFRDEAELAELHQFLTERLHLTHSLLCRRLGHPQLTLHVPANAPAANASPENAPS